MNKRAVWIVAVVVLALSAASILYRAVFPQRSAFDSSQWIMARSEPDYAKRYQMLPDLTELIASGAIPDKPAAAALLGKPERGSEQHDTWGYRLGADDASSARRHERWLELLFDSNDQLATHRTLIDPAPVISPETLLEEQLQAQRAE